MSTIGLKYHNEDIHNIIHVPMVQTVKSPRYKSKWNFAEDAAAKVLRRYNGHQTFGLAHYEAPESKNYLKKGKHPAVPVKVLNKTEIGSTAASRGLRVPRRYYQKATTRETKNFIKENKKKVLALQPKVPVPKRVETPRGTVRDLGHLLEMIKIRESDEYGQIPKYLSERKKLQEEERLKQEAEKKAIKEYKEKMGIGTSGMGENVYMLDKDSRQQILDGLKENWNELSKMFLKLPVITDTWTKIKRKVCLEKEIDQLEKDIRLVESHPYIYLERTDRLPFAELIREERERKMTQEVKEKEEEKEEEPEKEKEEEKSEVGPSPPEEAVAEAAIEEVPEKEEDKEIKVCNY